MWDSITFEAIRGVYSGRPEARMGISAIGLARLL
jgi:hypothetical protein